MIIAFAYQMTMITPDMRQMPHRLVSEGEASGHQVSEDDGNGRRLGSG
jgi:hypothetical protein